MLTSTNVEYTSGNPPDEKRGRLRPSGEDTEQDVNDVFLAHKDRDEKVGDNSVSNLSGVCLVGRREANEHRYVGRKGNAEKSPVNGEEQIAEISNRLGVPLLDVLIIEVTIPVEGFLFVRDILRRTTERRSGDGIIRFRSGREIGGLRFLNS